VADTVRVIGVHDMAMDVPVHLIEIEIHGDVDEFDFGEVTQELASEPSENWQVAYDEQELSREGNLARFAFFFHDLKLGEPLKTNFGTARLPVESPIPERLSDIEYEEP
jgi:hypothetical protein